MAATSRAGAALLLAARAVPSRASRVLCDGHAAAITRASISCSPAAVRIAPLWINGSCSRRSFSSSKTPSRLWTFDEVQRLVRDPKRNVVIVDTREPSELQATGHIPGAINIPITSAPDSFHIPAEEFSDRFGFARPGKDRPLLFYCKAGVRSRAAAALAAEAGWKDVGEFPGSWMEWEEKGGEVER